VSSNAFVSELKPSLAGAASLIWSTYLGDARQDHGYAIAADSAGNAYVVGHTTSSFFPIFHEFAQVA
jgi:Beta-propeller repeat